MAEDEPMQFEPSTQLQESQEENDASISPTNSPTTTETYPSSGLGTPPLSPSSVADLRINPVESPPDLNTALSSIVVFCDRLYKYMQDVNAAIATLERELDVFFHNVDTKMNDQAALVLPFRSAMDILATRLDDIESKLNGIKTNYRSIDSTEQDCTPHSETKDSA